MVELDTAPRTAQASCPETADFQHWFDWRTDVQAVVSDRVRRSPGPPTGPCVSRETRGGVTITGFPPSADHPEYFITLDAWANDPWEPAIVWSVSLPLEEAEDVRALIEALTHALHRLEAPDVAQE